MSHFTVFVITPDRPSEKVLIATLQPWHEYECTGIRDEYVINVDVTDKVMADYKHHAKEGVSVEEFAEYWNGTKPAADGRYYRTTNPNAKWDWWVIGGRWTGMFGSADQIKRGDLQIDRIRQKAQTDAAVRYDTVVSVAAGRPIPNWETFLSSSFADIKEAREAFWENPVMVDLRADPRTKWEFNVSEFAVPREEYLAKVSRAALTPFAVVKDGKWYEHGQMGWWASVSNEKDQEVWNKEVGELIDGLPADHWITLVDCHI